MSLRDFMRQHQEQTTETITVRLPSPDLWRIDDLAASLDVTRQRMIRELIKEGLRSAEAVSKDDDDTQEDPGDRTKRYFIVNTNKAHDPETHKAMLANGTVAAFNDPWKLKILRLQLGDVVFLYESGRGIVATGAASGQTEKVEYDGQPEEEYRQKLEGFRKVKPLSAKEIKQAINANLILYRTMIKVPAVFGAKIEKVLENV